MESTFQEYQSFSDSVVINEESLPAYARAKKRLEGYLPFENQLVRSDTVGFQLPCSQATSLLFVVVFFACLFVCLFSTTSNEKLGGCLGTWAVEPFSYRRSPKPSHCPVLDHLPPGNEADCDALRLTRHTIPYGEKFSRYKIFADWALAKISRKIFHGSTITKFRGLRQIHENRENFVPRKFLAIR